MGLKFSIIIPVYNVASYLRDCLDSVVNQSYPDWEAICIDDGATDGSGVILDEYAEKDTRIRVLHQKNAGVSAARNLGMENSTGDWVGFLDADDVLSPTLLEQCQHWISKDPAIDIVRYRLCHFSGANPFAREGHQEMSGCRVSSLEKVIPMNNGTFFVQQLCRRQILADVRFPLLSYCEDVVFAYRSLLRAHVLCESDAVMYGYRTRSGSASISSMTSRKLSDSISATMQVLDALTEGEGRFQFAAWRNNCNKLTEWVGYNLGRMRLDVPEKKRLLREWQSALHKASGLPVPILFQRVRLRLLCILPFPIVRWVLCTFLQIIKMRGVHRRAG